MSHSIAITVSDTEFAYLKRIALDTAPDEYIKKYLQMHLLGSFDKRDNEEKIHNKQFEDLKHSLKTYGVKQGDIANYFKVSPSSVSIFLKKENKKSHLYPKFFTHSTSKSLLFSILTNKYTSSLKSIFTESEIKEIKTTCTSIKDTPEILQIVSIAAVKSKELLGSDFILSVFAENLQENKRILFDIDYSRLKEKNLQYLHSLVLEVGFHV